MNLQQVISVENMRQSDAHTIAHHTTSAELMHRAAEGIANAVNFAGKVAIVCGKGNNGGDGYALACILCKRGIVPTIVRITDGFSKDGLYYYKKALSLGANEDSLMSVGNFIGYDIVVDCLLGTGFSGKIEGNVLQAIEQINNSSSYVISADINSGINGDTGHAEIAVRSDLTVSIGAYKTGLFLNSAPYYISSMVNVDIGIHILKDEYKLIDYSLLHVFEGYNSEVITMRDFFDIYGEDYGLDQQSCDIPQCILEVSKNEHKTIVVKTKHSAIIADLKYIYICADYAK